MSQRRAQRRHTLFNTVTRPLRSPSSTSNTTNLRGVRLAPEPWPSPVARARKGLGKNAIPEPSLEQRSARDPAGTEAAEGTADASAADEGCPGEREDHGIAPRLSSAAAAAVAVAAGSARVTGRGSRRREVTGLRGDSVPGTTRGVRGTEGNGEREKRGRGSHRAGHRESEKERERERRSHTNTHTPRAKGEHWTGTVTHTRIRDSPRLALHLRHNVRHLHPPNARSPEVALRTPPSPGPPPAPRTPPAAAGGTAATKGNKKAQPRPVWHGVSQQEKSAITWHHFRRDGITCHCPRGLWRRMMPTNYSTAP